MKKHEDHSQHQSGGSGTATGEYQGLQVPLGSQDHSCPDPNGFYSALCRLKSSGISFQTVIDVGASDGQWVLPFLENFPEAHAHLLEPKEHHAPRLQELCSSHENMTYTQKVASDAPGTLKFYEPPSDPFGGRSMKGVGIPSHMESHVIELPATSIDEEVERLSLKGPFVVKLDTHGHELPILEGAKKTLEQSNVVFLELYNTKIGGDCLLFWQMCTWMHEHGFRIWDLFDLTRRAGDGLLWQLDAIFLPNDYPAFANTTPKA